MLTLLEYSSVFRHMREKKPTLHLPPLSPPHNSETWSFLEGIFFQTLSDHHRHRARYFCRVSYLLSGPWLIKEYTDDSSLSPRLFVLSRTCRRGSCISIRDVGTTVVHHLVCLPTYMGRKQERSCGRKQRQMTKWEHLEPEDWSPLPLTHAENKGPRYFFSNDYSCTAPKLNTHHCNAKDAVTVQRSPRQRAEHTASSTAVPAAAFQYLQREREGRQESPLGHCPVKRPNRRTYQISDMEMHTPQKHWAHTVA